MSRWVGARMPPSIDAAAFAAYYLAHSDYVLGVRVAPVDEGMDRKGKAG